MSSNVAGAWVSYHDLAWVSISWLDFLRASSRNRRGKVDSIVLNVIITCIKREKTCLKNVNDLNNRDLVNIVTALTGNWTNGLK